MLGHEAGEWTPRYLNPDSMNLRLTIKLLNRHIQSSPNFLSVILGSKDTMMMETSALYTTSSGIHHEQERGGGIIHLPAGVY